MYRQDYHYHSTANPSGDTGIALSNVLLDLVQTLPSQQRICDLGCGNGYLAMRFAEQGIKTVGVDASQSGIDLAKSNKVPGSEFYCSAICSGFAQPLNIGQFDVVISSEVIEHLYHPADLLDAANEILTPGGYLILTTPYHGYLKNLAICLTGHFDSHFDPLWTGGHIKFFSVRNLSKLVQQAGFRNIRFAYFGRIRYLWKSMICIAQRG